MGRVFDMGHQLTIKARTDDVLAALKENRKKHLKDYEKAKKGFFKAAVRLLKDKIAEVKADEKLSDANAVHVSLQPPVCHEKVYDTAIRMLELHAKAGEETIELDSNQVDSLVHDHWDWSQSFGNSVAMYAVGAAR